MQHTVTVSPANGSQEGWQVRCFYWGSGEHPSPPEYNLEWIDQGGVFTAVADLHHGKNVISCDILAGVVVNISLDPPSPIYKPAGLQWPVTPSVPPSQTADFDTFFFGV